MTEVSWWQARILAGEAMGSSSSEVVPLADALGRTLSSDAVALTDLPGFPTAAMDGWVVCGPGPWTIVGTIDTGLSGAVQLAAGEAMRIGTGGAVPAEATAVIPFEAA
ncbi:MAG: molybdopterin molybdenumtransferase MoeA, partial [Actinobacteria bacterium]|nr:molybdopterin molybdenumtransferase MoeA [Actinomycetota bacterium]